MAFFFISGISSVSNLPLARSQLDSELKAYELNSQFQTTTLLSVLQQNSYTVVAVGCGLQHCDSTEGQVECLGTGSDAWDGENSGLVLPSGYFSAFEGCTNDWRSSYHDNLSEAVLQEAKCSSPS